MRPALTCGQWRGNMVFRSRCFGSEAEGQRSSGISPCEAWWVCSSVISRDYETFTFCLISSDIKVQSLDRWGIKGELRLSSEVTAGHWPVVALLLLTRHWQPELEDHLRLSQVLLDHTETWGLKEENRESPRELMTGPDQDLRLHHVNMVQDLNETCGLFRSTDIETPSSQ